MFKEQKFREIAPHVFENVETRARMLSAEKLWEVLRENLRRLRG